MRTTTDWADCFPGLPRRPSFAIFLRVALQRIRRSAFPGWLRFPVQL